jgi:hypothetical protein
MLPTEKKQNLMSTNISAFTVIEAEASLCVHAQYSIFLKVKGIGIDFWIFELLKNFVC